MSISIVPCGPADAERWDRFAHASPAASLYHLYGWRDVVEDTFAHPTFYLSALSGDAQIAGVLPLVHLKSRVFGNMLVSVPFFNYGGICAESPAVRRALLEAATQLAIQENADFLEIRHEDDWQQGLPRKTSKVSMRLALPDSADQLWKSLTSKLRNQVQRPRKEGMTAVVGRHEELNAFYDVFATNMRDLGTPVYPNIALSKHP